MTLAVHQLKWAPEKVTGRPLTPRDLAVLRLIEKRR
jgi:hypothetical protein